MTAALAQLITPDRRTALVVRAQANLRTPDSARSPSPDPTTHPTTGDPEHRQTTLSRQSRKLTTDTHPKKINRRDARSQCGRYERSRLDLPQMDLLSRHREARHSISAVARNGLWTETPGREIIASGNRPNSDW